MGQQHEKIEHIGGVTLDFSRYPGEDFYCDGAVEDEILELVKTHAPEEFPRLIANRKDWETLYHLSPARGNIVRWLPFTGREKVLEIGAGPGAVTAAAAPLVGQVDCVELSARRSYINAYRNRTRHNVTIHVGNFADVEPALPCDYDYILLIGVFEYARAYLGSEDAFHEELRRLLPHLKPGGRAVIAIENRLGLKYFAGCREDHTSRYFDGIEAYPRSESAVRTFSRPALERFFKDCGVSAYSFYYPYPDYKFASALYSDGRLPQASELTENIRNFDHDRLLLFDEKKAYGGIVEDGLYPVFSNSYLAVLGPALPVSYCKFSNDRAPRYQITTQLRVNARGEKEIVKRPATAEARAHVERLPLLYEKLKKRYEDGRLEIAPCRLETPAAAQASGGDAAPAFPSVIFPFIKGRPLEALLDDCLTRGDNGGFAALLREFYERTGYRAEQPIADYDMTFANILVDGDTWTAVDYEWAMERPMAAKELLFRALYCYILEQEERQALDLSGLLAPFGVTEAEIAAFKEKETVFQNAVTGELPSLGALRAQIGGRVIVPTELILENPALAEEAGVSPQEQAPELSLSSVQVYLDEGSGFCEENSYFIPEQYGDEGMIEFTVAVPETALGLRIDPALCPCLVLLHDALLDGEPCGELLRRARSDGSAVSGGGVLFTTHDPHFTWDLTKLFHKHKKRLPWSRPQSVCGGTRSITAAQAAGGEINGMTAVQAAGGTVRGALSGQGEPQAEGGAAAQSAPNTVRLTFVMQMVGLPATMGQRLEKGRGEK